MPVKAAVGSHMTRDVADVYVLHDHVRAVCTTVDHVTSPHVPPQCSQRAAVTRVVLGGVCLLLCTSGILTVRRGGGDTGRCRNTNIPGT